MARRRQVSQSFMDENEKSWVDVLPHKEVFTYLREKSDPVASVSGNILCTLRGDLFIWCQAVCEMLTFNLMQLSAYPQKDIYQRLKCAGLADSPMVCSHVLGLIPDEQSGMYIALHCEKGLAVMELHRLRGEHGEFAGGGESVLCRTVSVASHVFTINDCLTLVQVSWYPSSPNTLALLTSDNFLQLFNLAEPELPVLKVPLLPSSTGIQLHHHHGLNMDQDCVVGFSLWNRSAFILQDSQDVALSLISLTQHPHPLPKPLRIYPPADDNYWSTPSSLLVLNTTPLAVVVADKTGMVYHCVYLEEESADHETEEDESAPASPQKLYVVERVQIQIQSASSDSEKNSQLNLLQDPINPHNYFVVHTEGVHMIHMPWLEKLEMFASSDMPVLSSQAECQVTYLIATESNITSLQGATIVWEPLLGYALIGLTANDWECLTLSLDEPTLTTHIPGVHKIKSKDKVDEFPQPVRPALQATGIVKAIEDILHPAEQEFSPALKTYKSGKESGGTKSQADCYRFLMASITQLRMTYIIRQQHALKETERRAVLLRETKEQIISDVVQLRVDAEITQEESERLQHKIEDLSLKHKKLQKRAEKLAFKVRYQSPVFSEAEECMHKEMDGLKRHSKEMASQLEISKGKLKLFTRMNENPGIDLNASQSTTLLKKLTDNGEKIKMLASSVKTLCEVIRV